MNLVQKLPIGLGLACLMMMSSCSKEDVQAPEPVASHNTSSNLRVEDGIFSFIYLDPTYGPTGSNVFPNGWKRDLSASNDIIQLPAGTSSLTHLFGNPSAPWEKPLPLIPNVPNANSIVTISSHAKANVLDFNATKNNRSSAITKIKNLKPGKTYQINFYVATTINKIVKQGFIPGYAKHVFIERYLSNGKKISANMMPLNAGATWFKQTITFKADETEQTLKFSAFTDSDNTFSYAHIFVDHNSVEEIQPVEPLN